MISTERKLFRDVSTPLSHHLLPFAWEFNIWPFTPFAPAYGLLQYCTRRESYSRLFPPIVSPFPAISRHLPENSIFGHLPPFAPAYGQPLDPTSTFIDKNVITGRCCNYIYREKAISSFFSPIVPPCPAICLKIQFFAFYPHLRLVVIALFTPPLLLTKMLSLDAVVIIYTMRKLFQAVSTPLSCHLPPIA